MLKKVFVGQADLNGTGLYSYCPDHCLPRGRRAGRGRTDSDIHGGWSIVRSWSKLTQKTSASAGLASRMTPWLLVFFLEPDIRYRYYPSSVLRRLSSILDRGALL